MPRSTRSPATVSAPRAVSRPASSRWALWRRWRGFMTKASDATSRGPPHNMMSPSRSDPRNRITATTTNETIAPMNRAKTSKL